MTNFERWKSELTIEDLIEKDNFIHREDACDTITLSCRNCPAYDNCSTVYSVCLVRFRQWAEQEVDE